MLKQWVDDALCARRKVDPEVFFPQPSSPNSHAHVARLVCSACGVRAECLQEALSMRPGEAYGIWGGTGMQERRHMKYPNYKGNRR